ncbi:hypothetical protein BAMA_04765 [Bacillus manliponensis]|uniref:Uncharacterized protein n=1 Tax=Bacillus manliponensis TaxID=574376 RepID=A0A073JWA4_9BACI|nr:hypothetical protein [Bacillus manliponensis]KEK18575.1 hypothetical protein BAMA_04765 [Bacillus manliponensis]
MIYLLSIIMLVTAFKVIKHRFSTQVIEIEEKEPIKPYWDFKENKPVGIDLEIVKPIPPQESQLSEQDNQFYQELTNEIKGKDKCEEQSAGLGDSYYDSLYSYVPEEEPFLDELELNDVCNQLSEEESKIIETTGQVIGRENDFVHFYSNEQAARCWIRAGGEQIPMQQEVLVIIEKNGDSTKLLHWEEI